MSTMESPDTPNAPEAPETSEAAAQPSPGPSPGPSPVTEQQAAGRQDDALLRFWREWGKPLLIIVLTVASFRSLVADWNDVPTGSMIPTIMEGDRIFVNKLAYSLRFPFSQWHLLEWTGPTRGDIVVFLSPDDGKRLVKRVVGVPGDTIELRHNRLIVNGNYAEYEALPVEDPELQAMTRQNMRFAQEKLGSLDHRVTWFPFRPSDKNFGPTRLGQDEYFMMGDNRDNSRDSRSFGTVQRDRIVGQATAVAFSFDLKEPYWWMIPRARWNRFFEPLD
jgi:signal peptidase I